MLTFQTTSRSHARYAAAVRWHTPASEDVAYILGPRTRLGQQLLNSAWAQRRSLVFVARNELDVEPLEAHRRDNVRIARAYERVSTRHTPRSIAIICCAIGSVHPEDARDGSSAIELLHRDIGVVESILTSPQARECERIDVVLVSSVVAISPPQPRNGYGGSKLLAEAALESLLQRAPRARFSVVYPGRLTSRRRWNRPATWLQTSYATLAGRIVQIIDRGAPRDRVVGIDARLWLASRGLRVVATSLLARRR